MRNEKGAVALLAILALITLVGLIGYSMQRTSGLSAVTGGLYQGSEEAYYVADAGIQNVAWNLSKGLPLTGLVKKPFGRGTYTVTAMTNLDGTLSITSTGQVAGSQAIVRRRVGQTTEIVTKLPLMDTYIVKEKWDNYSLSTLFFTKNEQLVLLNMDLSLIPPTATVLSAILSLYLYRSDAVDNPRLYTAKEEWVDSQANWWNRKIATPWTKPGENFNASPRWDLSTKTPGWITVDITAQAQKWVDATSPNYGLVLKNYGAADYYYSSEYLLDISLRPSLTVTWKY